MMNWVKKALKAFKSELNMIKILPILILLLAQSYFCSAQKGDLEAVRVAYFTEQLQLKSDEAQKFWPIYNNYKGEVKSVYQDNKNNPSVTQEKLVELRKKYKNDFKQVLGSDERVNQMYNVDIKFRQMLKGELDKRKGDKE